MLEKRKARSREKKFGEEEWEKKEKGKSERHLVRDKG